ncbi:MULTISPECIES: hypothetical protein [unclassified Bradyrhizobium]|uniref:hypothetical protein n=1 Tax=unclassified Bradyrhizobium TaxID=2631580 RepID=UPI0020B39BC0|nr:MULTISPECIES: hypothetical protein [unclassified Bradyrhizobium]MCP3397819.1 hypothetical protein [Bradyrhizobium sp. CCGB20]MCP3406407.1 hypothetical protein [Bradyrhizobium sp. CCGB01]
MSAPPTRRLRALADVLMVHEYHTRVHDGTIVMIAGTTGEIRPHHGELIVTIRQRTSAATVRKLLGLAVLDVAGNGDLKLGRMPRPDEAPLFRDLLGLHARRA